MKSLFFFSLIGVVLLCVSLSGCGDFSPAQPLSQFAGDWKGIFGADSAFLSLSTSKDVVTGTAVLYDSVRTVIGAIDGIVNRNDNNVIEFSVSFPSFSIDGEGSVVRNKLTGEFRKWRTEQDEFGMPHILYNGGGNFILSKGKQS